MIAKRARYLLCAGLLITALGACDKLPSGLGGKAQKPVQLTEYPERVFWGDTHLHTANSPDAFGFGNRLGPEEALRFARGEEVTSTMGVKAKLARLSIDTAEMRDRDIRIADLPVFKVLGFEANQPAVILGIDMFADRRFVIDHPGLRLHVSPPAAPASGPKQP